MTKWLVGLALVVTAPIYVPVLIVAVILFTASLLLVGGLRVADVEPHL